MADVQIRKNEQESRYEAVVDGEVAGFAEYRDEGETVELPHTEVDDSYEGQGVGSALARGALEAVAEEGKQVRATCPFIQGYLEQHPQVAALFSGGTDGGTTPPRGVGGGGSF